MEQASDKTGLFLIPNVKNFTEDKVLVRLAIR